MNARNIPWYLRPVFVIGFPQMAHRPPLPRRWALYCALAYLIPIIMMEVLPPGEGGLYRELSWLTTLAPAFILSLHYGMRGAVVGLIAGTILYADMQLVLRVNLIPVNASVVLPSYIAYSALALAVGWLSQQLHNYYQRLVAAERLAVIGEVAVTIRHEVNNALAAIIGEAGLLNADADRLPAEDRRGVDTILEMANQIAANLRKLETLEHAPTTAHPGDVKMVDLAATKPAEGG